MLRLILSASLVTLLIFYNTTDLLSFEQGIYKIQDFAYHYLLVEKFWRSDVFNIYQLSNQLTVLSDSFGSQIYSAMPVGMTPTALVVFLPLVLIAGADLHFAYQLWISFSVCLLLLSLSSLFSRLPRKLDETIMIIAMFCSLPFINACYLGQTSIFALAALLYLQSQLVEKNNKPNPRSIFIAVLMLVGLSIKPQYLLIALPVVITHGYLISIIISSLTIFIAWGFLSLWLTPVWVFDYLSNLTSYATGILPSSYEFWKNSEIATASNLFFGQVNIEIVNTAVYCLFLILSITLAFKSRYGRKSLEQLGQSSIIIGYAGYLLFSPHIGMYEEILILAPTLYALRWVNLSERWKISIFYISIILFQYVDIFAWLMFSLKAVYFLFLLSKLEKQDMLLLFTVRS